MLRGHRPSIFAMLIALAAPLQAIASVPPAGWRPPTFEGPGVLCGDGFNFALQAREVATAGFPSEGYDPTYVRSHGGTFAITVYVLNKPEVEKQKVADVPGGSVYLVRKMVRDVAAGVPKTLSYWFEPVSGTPFSVDFFAAVPGQGGWSDFPVAEYQSVVRRVAFAQPGQQRDCLSPKPQS